MQEFKIFNAFNATLPAKHAYRVDLIIVRLVTVAFTWSIALKIKVAVSPKYFNKVKTINYMFLALGMTQIFLIGKILLFFSMMDILQTISFQLYFKHIH